ncbi:histidine kinase [Dactylosporangium sp. NPDC000555]|uniref:sensor histidine kinase n=1 Tax=Dactylosporangium sp. NPDC000555 TaxID=3154260 RepID=UPI003319CDD4
MRERWFRPGETVARRAVRLTAGVCLGAVTAVVGLAYLVGSGLLLALVLPWPAARRSTRWRVLACARRLAAVDQRRAAALHGDPSAAASLGGDRALVYLAIRGPVGLLGAAVLMLLLYVVVSGAVLLWDWFNGRPTDGLTPSLLTVGALLAGGVLTLFLIAQGIAGVAAMERRLARWLAEPTDREHFQRRIAELTATRADVVEAVNDERRRIERDLHDGVQQRLVALGMLLGRARRSHAPDRAEALLRQAHEQSQQALTELREVAWRIYPTALDQGGLAAALETVAERSSVPVRLGGVPDNLDPTTAAVAYFVVSEAVTNAAKHSGADHVTISVNREGPRLVVRIHDNGIGGADPHGSGLSGLTRRVAALDGSLRVDSPPGGPTTITTELPCA